MKQLGHLGIIEHRREIGADAEPKAARPALGGVHDRALGRAALRRHRSEAGAGGVDPALACVLSGPNLSKEILRRQPCASVVAAADETVARAVAGWCDAPYLRAYTSTDVVGVEVEIARLEGKWKMSQNRPAADIAGVVAGLAASADPGERAAAALVHARRPPSKQ